jgi:hypothetical protein
MPGMLHVPELCGIEEHSMRTTCTNVALPDNEQEPSVRPAVARLAALHHVGEQASVGVDSRPSVHVTWALPPLAAWSAAHATLQA